MVLESSLNGVAEILGRKDRGLDSMIPKATKLLIRMLTGHPKWSWGSRAIPIEGGRMGSTKPGKSYSGM